MNEDFITALMENVIESTMIPKVQVERIVAPILSMFIGDILTATFRDDSHLSGNIRLIAPEFPLKKEDNRQSTNIDWLMYNSSRDQLLLVELKTSDTSIRGSQNSIYQSIKNAIRSKGGTFLIKDLELLRDTSQESGKYQFVLENKVASFKDKISNCQDAKIIYIVPKSIENKSQQYADRVLTFSSMSQSISGAYSQEWGVIHNYLCKLDNLSQKSRNRKISNVNETRTRIARSRQKKWQGTFKFDEMVDFCREHGDEIVIGFTGGRVEFANSTLSYLKNRSHYKWDYSNNMGGKNRSDWLLGSTVISILMKRHDLSL